MARYNVSRLGRFSSPDPIGGDGGAPQSLNRYVYVSNDPENLVDPTGQIQNVPEGCSVIYPVRGRAGVIVCERYVNRILREAFGEQSVSAR
jgi:hypothetical protein